MMCLVEFTQCAAVTTPTSGDTGKESPWFLMILEKKANEYCYKKTEATIISLDGNVFTSWMKSKEEIAPHTEVYSTCHYTSSCLYMALVTYIGLLSVSEEC